MKAHIVTRITIAASPAEVYKYLTDLSYHYLWNPQLQTISPVIKLKKGSVYKTTSTVLGVRISAVNKVTKLLPQKELELQNDTGMVKYRVNFEILSKGKKSQVTCNSSVEATGNAFAFAKPVLTLLARRELQTDMQALKLAVEHELHRD